MPPILTTIILLILSNVFMTMAWYGHLADLKEKPSWDYLWTALCSLGEACFVFRSRLTGG